MKDRRKQHRQKPTDRRKKARPRDHLLTRIEDVTYHVLRRHELHKGGTVR